MDDPAPVIRLGGRWRRTAGRYRMDHERIQRLTLQRELEWREVQDYIDTEGCLMTFLAESLDDFHPEPCGKCTSCLGKPIVDTSFSDQAAIAAAQFLRRADMPLASNRQVAKDAFTKYGFKGNLPQDLRAQQGRVLAQWRDAGWGSWVADDKAAGRFRDELVTAVADLVKERWKPSPSPQWVTCVPSKSHPDLVPGFAKRLASALNLPFKAIVRKVRDNDPQRKTGSTSAAT